MDGTSRRRFDLLVLEHHEFLFESAAAVDLTDAAEGGRARDGRLWVCSRCVVFEPKDVAWPLEKMRFADMPKCPRQGVLEAGSGDSDKQGILIEVASRVELKRGGKSGPYVTRKEPARRVISLQHRSVGKVLQLMQRLWEVHDSVGKQTRGKRGGGLEGELLAPLFEARLNQAFDKSRLTDFREVLLTPREIRVSLVSQMTDIPGCIVLSDQRLYFQPAQLNNIGEVVQSFSLQRLSGAFKRRFLLRQRALEVRFDQDLFGAGAAERALLLVFEEGAHIRDMVFDLLQQFLAQRAPASLPDALRRSAVLPLQQLTRAWQRRELSNFEYLTHLNTLADRSKADLTQYPVFPWVIADYESASLDLDDPSTFRDLSKPIGALNEKRLENFRERFGHMQSDPDPNLPPFLYGTHYTTPGYVLYFLVRKSPDLMLRLQNGHFDRPDRSFHSVAATWQSVLSNPADLKELIPEFYDSEGDFLVNVHQLDLGRRQDGTYVDDVLLPPWCAGPRDFVAKCREALESEHVSRHLHQWIDLIFGYKQRGEEAVRADNLFYYLTYEGAVDLDKVQDENERKSYEAQIYEFGQTPKQLFTVPHPARNDAVPDDAEPEPAAVAPFPALPAPGSPPGDGQGEQQHEQQHEQQQHEEMPAPALEPEQETQREALRTPSPPRPPTPPSPSTPPPPAAQARPSAALAAAMRGSSGATSSWWSTEAGGTIQMYALLAEVKAHRGPVSGICASTTQPGTAYSISEDGSLSEVSAIEQTVKRRMAVGKLALGCCREVRDGNVLVGSWDNSMYVCSLEFGRVVNRVVAHDDAVSCVSGSGSGRVLATGSWESSVKIWSASAAGGRGFQPLGAFYDHGSPLTGLELDSSGQMVVSASAGGQVLVHDLRVGDVVQRFGSCEARGTHAVSVHWVHNETTVVTCAADGVVDIFDVASGRAEPLSSVDALLPSGSHVTAAALTPDRFCAVLGTSCGRVSLSNVNLLRKLTARNATRSIWRCTSEQPFKQRSTAAARARRRAGLGVGEQGVTALACLAGEGGEGGMILAGTSAGTINVLGRQA